MKLKNALRKGIEQYDRRHGWRGALTNKIKYVNWEKLDQNKIDPTLQWEFAEVINVDDYKIDIKILMKILKSTFLSNNN